jgi:tRNA dimethylallyltransferase
VNAGEHVRRAATQVPECLRRVVVVCGPTASGKTDLAAALAVALGGEVINADSRQVFRHLEIGTAKPSRELRARIPHHLLDVADPDERFDVADWTRLANLAAAEVGARGRNIIVCGGTGLYLRSFLRGLADGPAGDLALRAELAAEEAADPGSLHRKLALVDPPAAARIHANDRVRVIRALEVYRLTGEPISVRHARHGFAERHHDALVLETTCPPEELKRRIEARARAMVAAGLVEEVRSLAARFDLDATAFSAIGYREALACVRGEMTAGDVVGAIARSTRAYAKRQRTWIRGQMSTTPVAAEGAGHAVELAKAFLSSVATQ